MSDLPYTGAPDECDIHWPLKLTAEGECIQCSYPYLAVCTICRKGFKARNPVEIREFERHTEAIRNLQPCPNTGWDIPEGVIA